MPKCARFRLCDSIVWNHANNISCTINQSHAGVAFAAQGVSQFGNFSEAFTLARIAAYDALKAINRKPGSPKEIIYRSADDTDMGNTTHSRKSIDTSNVPSTKEKANVIKAILPKYEIDSTSDAGLKPNVIYGHITFKEVVFSYPTRPNETVLKGLSTDIMPGKTVAFVGPRYVL